MAMFDWLFGSGRRARLGALAGGRAPVAIVTAVAGLDQRRADAEAFCLAACEAAAAHRLCAVRLRPEPENAEGRRPIAVDGFAGRRSWHIGYLDRAAAAAMDHLMRMTAPLEAGLHSIRIGERGRLDIRIVLPVHRSAEEACARKGGDGRAAGARLADSG